jgi:hypothetical protein
VLRDLRNSEEVIRASQHLLGLAEVGDRLPTPVDDLIAAAGLHRGSDDMFADDTLAEAPRHLRDAIRRLRGKVHAALDRKQRVVYVDPSINNAGRRAFRALHEVGHDILPAQNAPAHGDDAYTLSWLNKVRWERDANQVAAELLFQRDRFTRLAAEYEIGLGSMVKLAQTFGGSLQAGHRRYVEFHRDAVAGVVLDVSPQPFRAESYKRYETVCSAAWESRFGRTDSWPPTLDAQAFSFVAGATGANTGRLVDWEGTWPDLDNRPVAVRAEIMSTSHKLLVLLWIPKRAVFKRHVVLGGRQAA